LSCSPNLVSRDSREARKCPVDNSRGGDTRSAKYRAGLGGLPDWRDEDAPQVDIYDAFRIASQLRKVEHYVAERAAHEAVRLERMHWLDRLEARLAEVEASANNAPVEDDLDQARRIERRCLAGEIGRLRRCLAVKKIETEEERRAAVRERVRKHRARAKANPDAM
jgi:hypothetical protein